MAEPQYRQVVDTIAWRIDDGYYHRGGRRGKLPSLRDMRTEFEVGPTTLKMALAILEDRGVIESRQGAGYYVTRRYGHRNGVAAHTADLPETPPIPDTSTRAPDAEPDTPCAAL